MSDKILISKVGLSETIKCTICKNPNQTERGCDGACQYDKELHAKIVEAVIGIAEQPHGEWVEGFTGYFETLYCDKCGYAKPSRHYEFNFCPNCGARMKEGEAE